MFNVVLRISWIGDLKSVSREFEPTTLDFVYDALPTEPDIAIYIYVVCICIYIAYIYKVWYICGMHMVYEVVGSNPTRANFLYGIEKP